MSGEQDKPIRKSGLSRSPLLWGSTNLLDLQLNAIGDGVAVTNLNSALENFSVNKLAEDPPKAIEIPSIKGTIDVDSDSSELPDPLDPLYKGFLHTKKYEGGINYQICGNPQDAEITVRTVLKALLGSELILDYHVGLDSKDNVLWSVLPKIENPPVAEESPYRDDLTPSITGDVEKIEVPMSQQNYPPCAEKPPAWMTRNYQLFHEYMADIPSEVKIPAPLRGFYKFRTNDLLVVSYDIVKFLSEEDSAEWTLFAGDYSPIKIVQLMRAGGLLESKKRRINYSLIKESRYKPN